MASTKLFANALALALACCLTTDALAAAKPKEDKSAQVAPPKFSAAGGVYDKDFKLELSAEKAVIHFSTDGSEPGLSSPVYKSPLEITSSAIVRARAFHSDGRVSATVSESYTLLADDLRRFNSNLPLIVVDSQREIVAGQKSLGAVHVLENKGGRTTPLSRADFSGLALLNVRGHSSLRYPKHSYAVKIVNEWNEPRKASILGLPKESDWVLYGPYPDKTLLRDALAYELSNQMGHWAPHTRFVEVFVNETGGKLGMQHYAGVYVFEEKITRAKSRVDITKLDPNDNREPEVTGGYIFKKDHSGRNDRCGFDMGGPPQAGVAMDRAVFPTPPGGFPADPAGFLQPYGNNTPARVGRTPTPARTPRPPGRTTAPQRSVTNHVAAAFPETVRLDDTELFPDEEMFHTILQRNQFYFYEPEPDEITAVQRAWLKDYVNRFESALYGPDFMDPQKGYQAFIDRDSFIDYHLFSEVTKNVDAFRFSTFYYKDRGGRLRMGPVWDWNLSFGNADGKQGWMPERWLWPQLDDQQYSWFRRLFEDPDFGQRYVDRWAQLRANVFATSNLLARINAMAAQLNEAQERNFARWEILGRDVSPNWFVGASYREEIDWMKDWTTKRLAWIEAQFPPTPTVQGGNKITLNAAAADAKIYFTLDGTDPRAPGGKVSAAARAYESPVAVSKDAKLFARTLIGTRWSAPAVVP